MTPPGEGLGFCILPEKSISGQGCQVKNGPNFNYENQRATLLPYELKITILNPSQPYPAMISLLVSNNLDCKRTENIKIKA